jgi:hypothetical protein
MVLIAVSGNSSARARWNVLRYSAVLQCPIRSFHLSTSQKQQQQQQSPRSSSTASSPPSKLPSIEPVLVELRTIVTRRYPLGDLYHALSPASRKILVAHKLPLEELLLHLPTNFAVWRVKQGSSRVAAQVMVSPPHLVPPCVPPLRLPPSAPRRPELAKLELAADPGTAAAGCASSSHLATDVGTGFIGAGSTPLDRVQEVLTYIPNDFAPFTELPISRDVKMRCMGYPQTRPLAFFMKYPKYFDVRLQDRAKHTFEVRRSLALQQQLQAVAPPRTPPPPSSGGPGVGRR